MQVFNQFLYQEAQIHDMIYYHLNYYFRMCQLSYSHIIKYESLTSEWDNFVSDIQAPAELHLPWENKGIGGGSLKRYFQQLTTEEENDLFGKFESDFKMFGYSTDDEF